LLDRRLADVLPALSESVTEAQFRRALRSGEAVRTRLQYNGETLHIHAFTWPGGLALTLRASTADDELERTEAEIEAIRRLLQMDRKMGIVRLSVRGTIAQVDEGFASLSKLPVERLLGVRFLDLLPRADRGRLGAAIEAVLGGERQAMAETVIVDNEGVDIAAHISITAIRDGFGASGAMLMIRDQRAF
jgi:PAS domain S-box-containing protein